MERKTKIELGLAIAVLIFALAFFIFWMTRAKPAAVVAQPMVQQNVPASKDKTTKTPSGTVSATTTSAPAVAGETSALTIAKIFVERLGSYSSEADAVNLTDILPLATTSLQKTLSDTAKKVRASSSGTYYGISTLVVTAPKMVSSSDTATVLSMTTQRQESTGTPGNSTIKYQNITVTLVKSGTTWLVDSYTWKEIVM